MTTQALSPQRQSHRLPTGGRIDRSRLLSFTVDGTEYVGHPGDTIASALLANGRIRVGDSIYRSRPRGIFTAGIEEPNALVRTHGAMPESMVAATVRPLVDGLHATTLSGVGTLDPMPDAARYDKRFVHADVVVVGAGPAGLCAALAAGRSGARVVLLDDQSELGGSLLSARGELIDGQPALAWVAAVAEELASLPDVTILPRTSVIGSYDANYVIAVEHRTWHLDPTAPAGVSRQRLWHVRARHVILATGAHERPIVFSGNDRPGVMLAGAVRTYLNRYAVLPGHRTVVLTTNDSAYDTVEDLRTAGADVTVLDARVELSNAARAAMTAGVRVLPDTTVRATAGRDRLESVLTSGGETLEADLLAVSGGWSPVLHLHSQRHGPTRWDDTLAAFVPAGAVRDQAVVGSAAGAFCLADALRQGGEAGAAAASATGFAAAAPVVPVTLPPVSPGSVEQVWLVPGPTDDWEEHFVDLQRDQTVADVWRATGAGMTSSEHVKRYTSIGTGGDQGKTSGVISLGVIQAALATAGGARPGIGEIGATGSRPPYTPVEFAALAGRERGRLFDPERTTPIHSWHLDHGAIFEIVGQWSRPQCYPRPGEDLDAAVARECRAARTGVAMQDASTLGKIEIKGKDAGEFLNRIYTNGFKQLKPGSARYGVMCKADGMMFDDGVTLRLDDDRYLMTTTTGNAAVVLDWLEEWLQTEWPELDVNCTSVTEQWATIAVVGPRSREVVAQVAPQLDVSADAFGFMTFRETTLASGVPARICRISFSGELAYEINVAAWYGLAVWEQVYQAGEPLGIAPYGTEAMHVLRAEKGFPIIGQDTDGTVTPQDAGMAWIVSKTKDFIGKRSFQRPDTVRPDRKHLVGVLPVDGSTRLPEGTQLIALDASHHTPPVPMEGHVTSSYHSEVLGRPFGLALIKSGRDRFGEILLAPVAGRLVEVEVTSPVFYDPEGSRRDG